MSYAVINKQVRGQTIGEQEESAPLFSHVSRCAESRLARSIRDSKAIYSESVMISHHLINSLFQEVLQGGFHEGN